MNNIIDRKTIMINDLFDGSYLDAKMLYVQYFNRLPDTTYISGIDAEKALVELSKKWPDNIMHIYRSRRFEARTKEYIFNHAIVVMDQCVIELCDTYADIWHDANPDQIINDLSQTLLTFKERQRRKRREINVVIQGKNGLALKGMEIKRTKLELDLFYNRDFIEVDQHIRTRLSRKEDKGIVLLHGLPGTGKTTYLRYLIGKLKKKVLFLPTSMANGMMNPEFISLLVNNPEAILIIEDAENVIMDRKHSPGSSVPNLLNISDGLLADFLNIQLICTFNNSLTLIDEALMRKGRLIAKYEFGKLAAPQAQRLSDHLGFKSVINRPMTIAEIANQHEKQQTALRMEVIGFRRHPIDTTHLLA
jgi:hypothetical protein